MKIALLERFDKGRINATYAIAGDEDRFERHDVDRRRHSRMKRLAFRWQVDYEGGASRQLIKGYFCNHIFSKYAHIFSLALRLIKMWLENNINIFSNYV